MANVTYLIGAGASAQAIPTVGSNFNERFKLFIDILDTYVRSDNRGVKGFLHKVKEELPKHYSIDTYVRKLGFQNEVLYKSIKMILSCYLLYEQMKYYVSAMGRTISSTSNGKQYSEILDPRYDVLYAALLDTQSKKLSTNINFISWNYDAQFELSLSEFLSVDILKTYTYLGVAPSPWAKTSADIETAQLLKLNGTAGLYSSAGEHGYNFYAQPGNSMNQGVFNECIKNISAYLSGGSWGQEDLFHFSWEDKEEVKEIRSRAKDIMAKTQILIIIGYSFPVYNRKVDRDILSKLQHAKVYLQVSKEHLEAYTERFNSIVPTGAIQGHVIPRIDLDQFFIPYELL